MGYGLASPEQSADTFNFSADAGASRHQKAAAMVSEQDMAQHHCHIFALLNNQNGEGK